MKLTNKLRYAITAYYLNRSRQESVKWDKESDLNTISDCTPKGYNFQAITGTFWFTRSTKNYVHSYETNEKIFPEFKYTKTRKKDNPCNGLTV